MRAPGIAVSANSESPWLDRMREANTPKKRRKVAAAMFEAAQAGDMTAIEILAELLMGEDIAA